MNHNLRSRLSNIDWDFAGTYSESPFSAIHFHPCRFASQVPATLIGLLTKPGDLVLDPFAGSGTTLVEAQRLGRPSVGIELNPIAVSAMKAKTLDKPASIVGSYITALKEVAAGHLGRQLTTLHDGIEPTYPASVQLNKWYVRSVAEDLGRLWSFIGSLEGQGKVIAEACFSALLLPVCRETRHWGYVCDNVMPQDEHGGDVLAEFCRVLDRLDRGYRDRDAEIAARGASGQPIQSATVIGGDASAALAAYPKASVDFILTSPPYFGVCDYIKAQRLSMEWFGIGIEELRLQEIGARSKRHRGEAAAQYLEGLRAVFAGTRRCMRRGASMAVLIGESAKRQRVLSELRDMFKDLGFSLELELNRTISTQRRQTPSILGEHLFLVTK
jgi:DNA modification methylase